MEIRSLSASSFYGRYQLQPLMMSFIGVMVVLDEIDNGIARYLCVTPLNKKGYLFTRFGVNSILVIPYTIIVSLLFRLYRFSMIELLVISMLYSIASGVIAMAIVTLFKNRVEGMALVKLISMLYLLGLLIPYLLSNQFQYILAALPTFWIARFSEFTKVQDVVMTLVCSFAWGCIFIRRFTKKILWKYLFLLHCFAFSFCSRYSSRQMP